MESAPRSPSTFPAWAKVLIVVVALCGFGGLGVGVLGALVLPNVVAKMEEATEARVRADLGRLRAALEAYAVEHGGAYPDSLAELDEAGTVDAWGREYVYEPPDAAHPRPRVYSLGQDGRPGGDGLDRDLGKEDR